MNATPAETREVILYLVSGGYSSPKIARVLGLGLRTVERVRSEARRKAEGLKPEAEDWREHLVSA